MAIYNITRRKRPSQVTAKSSTEAVAEEPKQSQQQPQKKRVHFNRRAKVYNVDVPDQEEKRERWYVREDFARMKEERQKMFGLVNHYGTKLVEKIGKATLRGMEHVFDTKRAFEVEDQRINSTEAVFDEQERQREEGLNDPEILSQIYHRVTFKSHISAHARALAWMEESQLPARNSAGDERWKATPTAVQNRPCLVQA